MAGAGVRERRAPMPRRGHHVLDACPRAPRSTRGALEGLTIRVGACWALTEDGAPGPPASVAPPLLRLGHLEAQETWASTETPANTHGAGLNGRLLTSGSVLVARRRRRGQEVCMAERKCPVCKKRPVWRTKQSNN